ncbi:6397_t:CDS:2, partial [Funneliformis caledonium]
EKEQEVRIAKQKAGFFARKHAEMRSIIGGKTKAKLDKEEVKNGWGLPRRGSNEETEVMFSSNEDSSCSVAWVFQRIFLAALTSRSASYPQTQTNILSFNSKSFLTFPQPKHLLLVFLGFTSTTCLPVITTFQARKLKNNLHPASLILL